MKIQNCDLVVSKEDRRILRDLAKRQMEYANLPIMLERKQRWYEHNALQGDIPMIVMEMDTFMDSIMPKPQCESSVVQQIENQLRRNIINHELINDDKVIPSYFSVDWDIEFRLFDLNIESNYADDGTGRCLGHNWKHPITDLRKDLFSLKSSTYSVDRKGTLEWKTFVEDIIGDILPVKIENHSLNWFFAPTARLVYLMGMEYMLVSILETPDEFHQLIARITEEMLMHLQWQEQENLLTLNNENHYAGAGSYGFTNELPCTEHGIMDKIISKDLWCNMNSQESIGISPKMYGEYIFPYYLKLAQHFGLVYYGCCEPVHAVWNDYVGKLPHLRKVSISPWCDERMMGERLRNAGVIYSRKPSPNFISVGKFDEDSFKKHIADTLESARGCKLEIIYRDIYSLQGDISRAGKAICIIRQLIDDMGR
jgi:hypothetical protein